MTHNAAHIILQSLKMPTKANGNRPVWHYVAAACLLCFVVGFVLGSL